MIQVHTIDDMIDSDNMDNMVKITITSQCLLFQGCDKIFISYGIGFPSFMPKLQDCK